MPQLYSQDGALKTIHAVVIADIIMEITARLSVIAHRAGKLRHLLVVGRERAPFAVRAEVFTGIKAEGRALADAAHPLAAITRSVRLAGVFDHCQFVLSGQL